MPAFNFDRLPGAPFFCRSSAISFTENPRLFFRFAIFSRMVSRTWSAVHASCSMSCTAVLIFSSLIFVMVLGFGFFCWTWEIFGYHYRILKRGRGDKTVTFKDAIRHPKEWVCATHSPHSHTSVPSRCHKLGKPRQ